MRSRKPIIVYWAPAAFNAGLDSWDMLYQEPTFVFSEKIKMNTHNGIMPLCPATKNALKNVVSLNSAIDDSFDLPTEFLNDVAYMDNAVPIPTESKIDLLKERKSSLDGYVNFSYNLKWLFFASEPLEARFTAPYFPNKSPVDGAILSIGQYDIGKWFRPFNLDYHVPLGSKHFSILENDPLAYIEFMTDRKIIFKRFLLSPILRGISTESVDSGLRYGKNKGLAHKYQMAEKSKIRQIVLSEISKNLIE